MNTLSRTCFVSALMLVSGLAQAEGSAPAQTKPAPTVIYQAPPVVINGAADDEAVLFSLPADATPELVKVKVKVEDLRSKLKTERTKLIELVKTFDFDKPATNQQQLADAIEACKAQVQDLEDAEAAYLLDRDLHVADVTSQKTTAQQTLPLVH